MAEDIKEIADKIEDELVGFKEMIKSKPSVFKVISAIPVVIKKVEEMGNVIKGISKKALAIELLNRVIDIPILPEKLECVFIGFAIDAIIEVLNKYLGKDWLGKINANF